MKKIIAGSLTVLMVLGCWQLMAMSEEELAYQHTKQGKWERKYADLKEKKNAASEKRLNPDLEQESDSENDDKVKATKKVKNSKK